MSARIERVVVISDDSVSSGGAAGIALSSVRLLARCGLPITVLTGDDGSNPELRELGVEVVALGGSSIHGDSGAGDAVKGLYNTVAHRMVSEWIARNDTPSTIYHLHNWHKFLSPSVFSALRKVESRLVMTAHDHFLTCPNGGFFLYPQGRPCTVRPMSIGCVTTACDRRSYVHKVWRVARQAVRERMIDLGRTSATIIAVHEGMIPFLRRGGVAADAIEVIRNPVLPWRAQRVAAENNRDAFYVGRIDYEKGVDLAAEAARRAGIGLQVVGDGEARQDLAARYPQVRFHGRRTHAEIAGLIADARLLVAPTRCHETFGLAVFEAATSGVPTVVSKYALVAEEIQGSGFGLSCDPIDVDGLADRMKAIATSDETAATMSRKAFAAAARLAPTPEEWRDRLLDLYERKLAPASRAGVPSSLPRYSGEAALSGGA